MLGNTTFAVLLMQDLAVVPLLALVPIVSDTGPLSKDIPLWEQIVIVVAMLGVVGVSGRYLVPRVLDHLTRHYNREAFF
ncbi:MAG: portal protein, partial [bacterium]|nr:portal protein [bacterium]